ncbi:MAG TPA: glycoside hydrolase family 3 N-terminal domain-containing protein [Planctomycetota bacterium]|nr:glycoside hydrolase family 3 N-terminal domain-containing protein [Planctomycetota bacterium]
MRTHPNARLVVPALRLPAEDLDPLLRLAARGVGGFCVFGGDLSSLRAILERLQAEAPHPLLFASDVEDGAGQQVKGLTRHPPAAALDPDAAEAAGVRTAVEARLMGLTMAFAPVCDVLSTARNPIIQARAFRHPPAPPRFVRGARAFGLRTCAKHFPGHGATSLDSHDALPVVDADLATWRKRDLPPFQACIDAGVDAVMTAHVACPALTGSPTLPATLSRAVMTDLLRKEMGFSGLAVTDALLMEGVRGGRSEGEAALLSLEAGCDALLVPGDVEAVLAAVERAVAPEALARMAAAADPLPDPLAAAAEASVACAGDVRVGPGPHAPQVLDLDRRGAGEALARAIGGLSVPSVLILRSDRAWGGALALPAEAREAVARAPLVILLGPPVLLDGLAPRACVQAPGHDPLTVAAVARRVRG